MGIGNKYSGYDCGCGQRTPGHRNYNTSGCCRTFVQAAPEPCCESHVTRYQTGVCFRPAFDVAAVKGESGFFLVFSNSCAEEIPLNVRDVFFYHFGAGLLRIIGRMPNGGGYNVQLVDETKDGVIIQGGSCVLVTVISSAGTSLGISRCLSGQFVTPELNQSATITIFNGSGIPIGSTLTFTAGGETGSYVVTSYLSASGSIFAYTVTNTGSGHTPGLILDGGSAGACNVPIEIITEVDLCNLSSSQVLDNITGCVDGSPRAGTSAGLNSVLVGEGTGKWTQKTFSYLDCCVTILGSLKFSGASCPDGSDQVILSATGVECFVAAFNEAQAAGQGLPMNLAGYKVVATAYESGPRLLTLLPAANDLVDLVEFPPGSQLCLGNCCAGCLNGDRMTDARLLGTVEDAADVALDLTFPVTTGVSYWLIGYGLDNVALAYPLVPEYFDNPGETGPKLPFIASPMIFRQKICNESSKGCGEVAELTFNFDLIVADLADGEYVDWEFKHYAGPSLTLADGVTPNPFSNISTQQKKSDRIYGPTQNDTPNLGGSSFGFGGPSQAKVFPNPADELLDTINLSKCACAQSMLWCFLRVTVAGDQNLSVAIAARRQIRWKNVTFVELPPNTGAGAGFAS